MTDSVTGSAALDPELSGALDGFDGFLRCETCHRVEPLGNPGRRVTGEGWPKCCGYTMRWWTQRQINAGERAVMTPPENAAQPFDVARYVAIVNLRERAARLYDQLRAEGMTHARARATVRRQVGGDLDWMRGGK